jgi:hypothetical protein
MTIMFNPQALDAFAKVNFGNNNAIANVGEGDSLVKNKELGSVFLRMFRLPSTEERNNAVRTELLKALGEAFGIDGVTTGEGGKTKFSDGFMRKLEEILGPDAFRRGDFGIKGGEVASGKPLTQRRIKAIITAACAKSESGYDANAYAAKADAIADAFKGRDRNALSTRTAQKYVDAMKRTIDWLENDLEGFDAAVPGINNFDRIKDFIYQRTKLYIYPDEIRSFLARAEAAAKPAVSDDEAGQNNIINIDDLPKNDEATEERRANIKTFVIDRLQTMVKESIDICLKAIAAGKADEVMEIINNDSHLVEYTLRDLEEFRRTQLINEIPEDANGIVENNNAGKGNLDDDIEDRNSIIEIKDPPKPKQDEPEEKFIQVKDPPKPSIIEAKDEPKEEPKIEIKDEPKVEAEEKEHIEIKDDAGEDNKIEDDASENGEIGGDESEIEDDDGGHYEIDDEPEAGDDSVIESTFNKMSDSLALHIGKLPESTQKKFKIFYYSTVRDFEAKKVISSKPKDFDDALDNLLGRIGGRQMTARRLVVELIAGRKLNLFDEEGNLLPPADINARADQACGLGDMLELYRKGATGDIVFDLAFKAVSQKVSPDGKLADAGEFKGPAADEVKELQEAAEEFNFNYNVFGIPDKKGVADALRKAMDAAAEHFEENLRKEGDSELTAAAKKNIFVAFATVNFLRNQQLVMLAMRQNHDELMQDKKQRAVLESIAPAYEWITNMKLNGERVTI